MNILVAGIGNIFLGDDAFGCTVAQRFASRPQPEGARVVDFGIRGFDLAYALMEKPDLTIFVDATPQGGAPGTVYAMELDPYETGGRVGVDMHSMNPMGVLEMVKTMGGDFGRILLVGCEPESFGDELEGRMGLSEPVSRAVDEAVEIVESLVRNGVAEAVGSI
jgi:hydrogenase maturation protease